MKQNKKTYEFGSFDKYGNLDSLYFVGMIFFIFSTSFFIFTIVTLFVVNNESFFDVKNYLIFTIKFFNFLYLTIKDLSFLSFFIVYKYSTIFSLFLVFIYVLNILIKKLEQRKLANYGLEDYFLYKKLKDGYIYKVVPGCVMDYDKFLKQFNNMVQRNKMGSCEIKRFDKVGVQVRFKNKTPSIDFLNKYKIEEFVKPQKLFLGFQGGFKEKALPTYINFKDLPHSFALLGTSGGGKSNTLNHILFSVLYNFQNIYSLTFVDFKGGVEAQPYKNLEDKLKTGKIEVYTDNRLDLYKKLIRLDIINKSRQKFLKDRNMKKFTSQFIYIFFDEIAELLDYSPTEKNDKLIHTKTKEIVESLFRTSRSSGFKLFYATQIFTTVGSGLTNSIKNNTIFRILHKTESDEGINSVIDKEPLEERGINVKEFGIGEMIIKNESEYYNVRTLYIPDDFITKIKINNKQIDLKLQKELDSCIRSIIETYKFDEELYKREDCLKDFNLKDLD